MISRTAHTIRDAILKLFRLVFIAPLLISLERTVNTNQPQSGRLGFCQTTTLPFLSVNAFLISLMSFALNRGILLILHSTLINALTSRCLGRRGRIRWYRRRRRSRLAIGCRQKCATEGCRFLLPLYQYLHQSQPEAAQ
jgi:hypothetical protein